MFLKVKGFAFRGAFTFYSRSRFYVAPLVSYVYIIRIGRVARKAGCDRWLVKRRIPRTHLMHTTHQPIYLPMNTSSLTPSFPLALITPLVRSPQTTNMLQALKRLFNICRGARSIYVESVHKSRYVRTPGNPTAEFVKVGIQPADFNPLLTPNFNAPRFCNSSPPLTVL